jgi:hypothetical protein
VFAKGFGADVTIQTEKVPKTKEELEVIMRALSSCYLFAAASDEQREELAQYMHRDEVSVGVRCRRREQAGVLTAVGGPAGNGGAAGRAGRQVLRHPVWHV